MADKFTFSSAGEIQEVEFALARGGFTHSLLKRATGGDFFGLIREVLEGRAEICRKAFVPDADNAAPRYVVTVDYGLTLEEMVAAGRYDRKNTDITAGHFPLVRSGAMDVGIVLVHFNRYITSDEALRELDKMGFRPAKLEELLAFGARFREVQREFPIMALGSVWRHFGPRRVPCLWGSSGRRRLSLLWFGHVWDESCRFAAVRK